jgi:hypothetical protein
MRQAKAVGRTLGTARRVALTSLGAGMVVGAGAPLASAATIADSSPAAASATAANPTEALANGALEASTAALAMPATANLAKLGRFKLYPLAGTGIDPLSNVVGTSLGGIPVSTQPVTAMVADGLPVSDLPVVGALFNAPRG